MFRTLKEKGRAGLSLAIAYFGTNGYTVSIPLNDTQDYDLIIEKNGMLQTVQCKATGANNNQIALRTTGCNTKGSHVYKTVIKTKVDILFCVDKDMNLFSIPVAELKKYGNTTTVKLRTKQNRNKNQKAFPSEKYQVFL